MSSIISYKCSNPECSLNVSLRVNFPVWSDDVPCELMKVPIGSHNEKYVLGYKSQSVCWRCNKIVDVPEESNLCLDCGTGDMLLEEGVSCLKCNVGSIVADEGLMISF